MLQELSGPVVSQSYKLAWEREFLTGFKLIHRFWSQRRDLLVLDIF